MKKSISVLAIALMGFFYFLSPATAQNGVSQGSFIIVHRASDSMRLEVSTGCAATNSGAALFINFQLGPVGVNVVGNRALLSATFPIKRRPHFGLWAGPSLFQIDRGGTDLEQKFGGQFMGFYTPKERHRISGTVFVGNVIVPQIRYDYVFARPFEQYIHCSVFGTAGLYPKSPFFGVGIAVSGGKTRESYRQIR